jgi:hypothetical protein
MYAEQDLSRPASFYYTIENEVFFDIDPKSWNTMFCYLNLGEKNAEFLAKETDNLFLRYIGFDKKNRIDKLGFHTLYEFFSDREPLKYYSNYKNFENIFYTIKNITDNDLLSLQYSPIFSEYLGVEISVEPNQITPVAKKLYDNFIMTEEQYNNITEMNISDKFRNSVLKFRWENENTFDIKFYLQKGAENE